MQNLRALLRVLVPMVVLMIPATAVAQAGDYALTDNSGNVSLLVLETGGTGYLGDIPIQWQKNGDDVWVWDPESGVIFELEGAGDPNTTDGDIQDSAGADAGDWEAIEGEV